MCIGSFVTSRHRCFRLSRLFWEFCLNRSWRGKEFKRKTHMAQVKFATSAWFVNKSTECPPAPSMLHSRSESKIDASGVVFVLSFGFQHYSFGCKHKPSYNFLRTFLARNTGQKPGFDTVSILFTAQLNVHAMLLDFSKRIWQLFQSVAIDRK